MEPTCKCAALANLGLGHVAVCRVCSTTRVPATAVRERSIADIDRETLRALKTRKRSEHELRAAVKLCVHDLSKSLRRLIDAGLVVHERKLARYIAAEPSGSYV